MNKYRRLTKGDISTIAEAIADPECKTLAEASERVGMDPSGVRRAIIRLRTVSPTKLRNRCGLCRKCHVTALCEGCPFNGERECRNCPSVSCNSVCPAFRELPDCRRLTRWPYCCNGCDRINYCRLTKAKFDPIAAYERTLANRSEPRTGIRTPREKLDEIEAKFLIPLLKGNGQSLLEIYQTHGPEMPVSIVTLYSYIDRKAFRTIRNIDLQKKVKYPGHYRKKADEPTNKAFLAGRTYDEFLAAFSADPAAEVVEMDTVVGPTGTGPCLLTLLFRKSNFMLAFWMPRKTSAEVAKVFARIRRALGKEAYSSTFRIILTDNGSEFADPMPIECDPETGEKLVSLYYCEPGKSGQKGKIEKNHVELRKVFPKGTDFTNVTQAEVDLALCHINSEPRRNLNGNCPGVVAKAFLNEKVPALNRYRFIKPDEVRLTPSLIR